MVFQFRIGEEGEKGKKEKNFRRAFFPAGFLSEDLRRARLQSLRFAGWNNVFPLRGALFTAYSRKMKNATLATV